MKNCGWLRNGCAYRKPQMAENSDVNSTASVVKLGRGEAVSLPDEETERRSQGTTAEWPIMHGVLHVGSRDQILAQRKANHVQVVYAISAQDADRATHAKALLATTLGISVQFFGV